MSGDLGGDGRLGAVGAGEGEVNGPDPDHEAHAALSLVNWSVNKYKYSSLPLAILGRIQLSLYTVALSFAISRGLGMTLISHPTT